MTETHETYYAARLIKGRFYSYKGINFYKDTPVKVGEELACELEDLTYPSIDSDGEIRQKPFFGFAEWVEPEKTKDPVKPRKLKGASADGDAGAGASDNDDGLTEVRKRIRAARA